MKLPLMFGIAIALGFALTPMLTVHSQNAAKQKGNSSAQPADSGADQAPSAGSPKPRMAGGHGPPDLKRVLSLQSLSPDQRKQIVQAMKAVHQQVEKIRTDDQAAPADSSASGKSNGKASSSSGSDSGGAGPAGGPGGGMAKLSVAARKQIREARVKAWQQVKGILSDDQLKEFEQMPKTSGPGNKKGGAAASGDKSPAKAGSDSDEQGSDMSESK